jgi:hypothetical protein
MNNWICSKVIQLEMMTVEDLWKLEYCNDQDFGNTKPTRTTIKEVSFIKNNPKLQEVDAKSEK